MPLKLNCHSNGRSLTNGAEREILWRKKKEKKRLICRVAGEAS